MSWTSVNKCSDYRSRGERRELGVGGTANRTPANMKSNNLILVSSRDKVRNSIDN